MIERVSASRLWLVMVSLGLLGEGLVILMLRMGL